MMRVRVECPVALNGAQLLRRIANRCDRDALRRMPDVGDPGDRPSRAGDEDKIAVCLNGSVAQLLLEFRQEPAGRQITGQFGQGESQIGSLECRRCASSHTNRSLGYPILRMQRRRPINLGRSGKYVTLAEML